MLNASQNTILMEKSCTKISSCVVSVADEIHFDADWMYPMMLEIGIEKLSVD